MEVLYNGQLGELVAETSIVGEPFVTWIVRLKGSGKLVEGMMYEFEIPYVSCLDAIRNKEAA